MFKYENQSLCIKICNGSIGSMGADRKRMLKLKEKFNLQKGKICLSGHSAGGHLTAANKDHPFVSHAFPLSALVDLEPISLSFWSTQISSHRY